MTNLPLILEIYFAVAICLSLVALAENSAFGISSDETVNIAK